jgi:hypothetical protein
MLQIECSCGRIAEVRHRKNGQKLAYKHCNECGVDLGNKAKAATIEAQASEDIGVKGEFLKQNSSEPIKNEQSKQTGDFKPDAYDLPENLEPNIKKDENEIEEIPVKTGNGLKILAGVLGAAIFGGGVYQLSKLKG